MEWEAQLPAPPAAGGAADAERIYVPLDGGAVVAVSRDTGTPVWSRELNSPWVPRVEDDLLLVTAPDAIHTVDVATGGTVQTVELPAAAAGPVRRTADLMVASLQSGTVLGLREDGVTAWKIDLGAPSLVRPAVRQPCDGVYLALDGGRLAAVGCDGRPRWSRMVGGTLTAPVLAGDRVLVGSTDDRLYAFDAEDGRLAWHWKAGNDVLGAVADDDQIYLASLDNIVRALDRDSGNLRWQQVMPTRAVGPPFQAGSRLFVPGVRPALMVYDTETGAPLESLTLPDSYALAVLAGPPLVLSRSPGSSVEIVVIARDGRIAGLRASPEAAEP